jgi:hypothetical protein
MGHRSEWSDDGVAAMEKVRRVCAWWTLAAGLAHCLVRYLRYNHRWFLFSGAALLQAACMASFGVSYL